MAVEKQQLEGEIVRCFRVLEPRLIGDQIHRRPPTTDEYFELEDVKHWSCGLAICYNDDDITTQRSKIYMPSSTEIQRALEEEQVSLFTIMQESKQMASLPLLSPSASEQDATGGAPMIHTDLPSIQHGVQEISNHMQTAERVERKVTHWVLSVQHHDKKKRRISCLLSVYDAPKTAANCGTAASNKDTDQSWFAALKKKLLSC